MKVKIVGWSDHQHYKHRSPPWIKLHLKMLNEFDEHGEPCKFRALPDRAKMLFPFLLLVASRYDGILPSESPAWLAKETGLDEKSIILSDLIASGLLTCDGISKEDALATCLQGASNAQAGGRLQSKSTETDTETETDAEGDARGNNGKAPKTRKTRKPAATIEETMEELKAAYKPLGVDVDRELVKCHQFFKPKGITPSLSRFVNWLNRADKQIPAGATGAQEYHHRGLQEHIEGKMLL